MNELCFCLVGNKLSGSDASFFFCVNVLKKIVLLSIGIKNVIVNEIQNCTKEFEIDEKKIEIVLWD